ncbi:MAG TPA: FAD-dependent monooxygenase [Pseudonocardiaceae bacterium]
MLDVVIVGGGPVGLFLACELKLAGIDPVVLERLPEPSQADKAHGLTGQVVRLLDHRGLFERFGGTGAPVPAPLFFFGTIPLPLHVLGADNPLYYLPINQRDIERALAQRAAELGVEVRRGQEVHSLTQFDDHVELLVGDTVLGAKFVVGCDGGHSVVRKQSGIAFPGIVDEHVVARAGLVSSSERLSRIAEERGLGAGFQRTEQGVIMIAMFDAERPFISTLEWEDDPEDSFPGPGAPMTLAELEASVERVLGEHVTLADPPVGAPTLLRRIKGRNTRLAEHYRDRRVFLAGDAAHVHAASGGPGLNLGLQDAANLGWKLAAQLHGWAPETLLDSYQTERRALGARVFMQTQSQTALMAPGSDVTALRELFGEMLTRQETVRQIADLMAGSDVRYDMGEPDPADATGWFAPNVDLVTEDGQQRRLAELCRDGRTLLLDLAGDLADAVEPWSDRVVRVAAYADNPPADALLIRPDGYVAWAGTEPDGLQAALRRWLGEPAVRSSRAA